MSKMEEPRPTAMELAESLLARRVMLREALPGIIRNLQAEEESILPKMKRAIERHEKSNRNVASLKNERDVLQKKAATLLNDLKNIRNEIEESGGMVRLDPNWAKERLEEKLTDIENRIETQALDHKAERKMITMRSNLLKENEKWLKERRDSNPMMVTYVSKRRAMAKYFKEADKIHSRMLDLVERGQPLHQTRQDLEREYYEIRKQLDRARELNSQSDAAVSFWEGVIESGFEKGAGMDLLKNARSVEAGNVASFAKKTRKKPAEEVKGEDE